MMRWLPVFLLHTAILPAFGDEGSCASDQAESVQADALLQKSRKATRDVVEEMPIHSGDELELELDESLKAPRKFMRKSAVALLDDFQGPGAYEGLDEDGYQTVAATCCNYQMETFIRRVIDNMELELCGEGSLMGFVPYYSCEKGIKDYATLVADLTDGPARTAACPVAASPGTCPDNDAGNCPGEPDPTYHRRRNCKSATTTTTSKTTTTGETTTTLTTTTLTTTTSTTTTTVTTTTETTTIAITSTTVTTTTSTGCKGEVDLFDFFDSTLTHTNLGNAGPDPGAMNMRYEGIGVKDGAAYDMVVTADTPYTPAEVIDNGFECGRPAEGCINGRFGAVSVAKGTSVDLTISFQNAADQAPLTLTSFLFSLHDIDQFNSQLKEKIYITGFSGDPILANGTEVNVKTEDDGRTSLTSRQNGVATDNPTDPLRLAVAGGVDQRKRSAAFLFENVDAITLTFEVICDGCATTSAGEIGRTFLFSGDTNLVTCAGRGE